MKTLITLIVGMMLFSGYSLALDTGSIMLVHDNWELETYNDEFNDVVLYHRLSIATVAATDKHEHKNATINFVCSDNEPFGNSLEFKNMANLGMSAEYIATYGISVRFDKDDFFKIKNPLTHEDSSIIKINNEKIGTALQTKDKLLIGLDAVYNYGYIKLYVDLKQARNGIDLFYKKCKIFNK